MLLHSVTSSLMATYVVYSHLVLLITLPPVKCKCLSNVRHLLNFDNIKTNNIAHLSVSAAVDFTCLSQIDRESIYLT